MGFFANIWLYFSSIHIKANNKFSLTAQLLNSGWCFSHSSLNKAASKGHNFDLFSTTSGGTTFNVLLNIRAFRHFFGTIIISMVLLYEFCTADSEFFFSFCTPQFTMINEYLFNTSGAAIDGWYHRYFLGKILLQSHKPVNMQEILSKLKGKSNITNTYLSLQTHL